MKENFATKIIWDEEDRVLDPNVLMLVEHSLHEEVIQSAYEQQDEIVDQASKKVSLDEFMVDDRNVSVRFQKTFEVAFLMIDECDECNENMAVILYEDDLPYIQTSVDQTIQDSLSDSSSYVSCFEMFFEEEIYSSTCSEIFEDQDHTFLKYIMKEDQNQKKKTSCFLSKRWQWQIFMFFRIQWQICCSQ